MATKNVLWQQADSYSAGSKHPKNVSLVVITWNSPCIFASLYGWIIKLRVWSNRLTNLFFFIFLPIPSTPKLRLFVLNVSVEYIMDRKNAIYTISLERMITGSAFLTRTMHSAWISRGWGSGLKSIDWLSVLSVEIYTSCYKRHDEGRWRMSNELSTTDDLSGVTDK